MKLLWIFLLFLSSCKSQTYYGGILRPDDFVQVSIPSGFSYTPPFDIYKRTDNTFYIDPTFDLSTYSGITVTKTYYVDKSIGSDSNDGLSWASPLATITAASTKLDVDQIYYKGYYYQSEKPNSINRSIKFIAADSNSWITGDVGNVISSYTSVSNYYWCTLNTATVNSVYDFSVLTSEGKYSSYKSVASIAEVNAEAGTFFADAVNDKLYVRCLDGRAPDSNIKEMYIGFYSEKNNITYYFEGGTILGGYFANSTATGGAKAYFKGCNIFALTLFGIDAIIQDCNFVSQVRGDVINIDAKSGIVSNVIEIGLNPSDALNAGNHQASTGHNGCNIIRINGTYSSTSGQGIADVSSCKTWMLGCVSQNSTLTDISYYCGGATGKMWLDACTSLGNTIDIETETGSIVYIKDFISGGIYVGTGTVTSY